ncbi:MAG: hypothetical protein U9N35_03405 [Euryarchaeota archaeon]|nr:hypothetical protein [Euryarchaeota archaeon]
MINKLSKLNRETKTFFVILWYILVLGIALMQETHYSTLLLGHVVGALLGVIYLYGIDRLEIYEEEKYEIVRTLLSEKVSIKIKGYFFLPLILFSISTVAISMERTIMSFFFVLLAR